MQHALPCIYRSGLVKRDQYLISKSIRMDNQQNRLLVNIRINPYHFQSSAVISVWRDGWEEIVSLALAEKDWPSYYALEYQCDGGESIPVPPRIARMEDSLIEIAERVLGSGNWKPSEVAS